MTNRFNTQTLWPHLPAALLIAMMLAALGWAWPFPDPAPVHFDGHGLPDRWGAPWEIPLIMILTAIIALGLSMAVDNVWSQQEKRKRFNWLSLLDELFEKATHIPVWLLSLGNAVVGVGELEAKMTRCGRRTKSLEIASSSAAMAR